MIPPTIEEILEQRIKSEETKKSIESQWTIDELGFNSKADQLQKQRWNIETLERENYNSRDKSFRTKNEKIDGIRNLLSDQESLFRKQITLASLKHAIPTMGKFQRDDHISYCCNSSGSANEEMLYETPLVKVIATYSLTDKPTNKIDYVVGIYAHCRFKDMINRILGIAAQFNKHFPEHDTILKFKSFKTLEDAKSYNERNKYKIIQEWILQIEKFNDEVQSASDNLESVFDFRLIDGDVLSGYYSGSKNYKIESKEKNKMVISWSNIWENEGTEGSFVVTLSGWQIYVDPANETTNPPDAIQMRRIYGALIYNRFNLPHLYDFMRDISAAADEQEKREQHEKWIAELAEESSVDLEDYLKHIKNADEVRKEIEEHKRRVI
jgi:hypothetical protein